jgi:hypothetical protein
MIDYSSILEEKYPSLQWSINGENYEDIIVFNGGKLPSKKELDSHSENVKAIKKSRIADQQRQSAYQTESDPLFFKYQAGEATEQDWLDKRNEIKARIPKE